MLQNILHKLKYYLPYELAIARAISFFPLICSTFHVIEIPLMAQLLLATVIMGSDVFDGKISRASFSPREQLRFRLTDTTTDKTGILSCLIGLLVTNRIPPLYFIFLLFYHSALLGGGIYFLKTSSKKEEKNVQGLFLSRLFTAMVGFSILLCNNVVLSPFIANMLTLGMGLLGMSSLHHQWIDKYFQKKKNENKHVDCYQKNQLKKKYLMSHQYIRCLQNRMMRTQQNVKVETKCVAEVPKQNLSSPTPMEIEQNLDAIVKGFCDIDAVLSRDFAISNDNIILSQIPDTIPLTKQDLLHYITSHKLIETTLLDLYMRLEEVKQAIDDLHPTYEFAPTLQKRQNKKG